MGQDGYLAAATGGVNHELRYCIAAGMATEVLYNINTRLNCGSEVA